MKIIKVLKEDLEYLIKELINAYETVESEWGDYEDGTWGKLEEIEKRYKIKVD